MAERAFKPRRPHSKSRHGCKPCRDRRIKCDENQPVCTRCVTRKVKCVYLKRGESTRETRPLEPAPSLDPETESSDENLFRHWLFHTTRTTAQDEQDWYALRVGIPSLQSKAVRHAILALSAMCLCVDHNSTKHLTVAQEHHSKSIQALHHLISSPKPADCDRIMATTGLLIPFVLGHQRMRMQMGESIRSTLRESIFALSGVRTISQNLNFEVSPDDPNGDIPNIDDEWKGCDFPTSFDLRDFHSDTRIGTDHELFPFLQKTWSAAFNELSFKITSSDEALYSQPEQLAACNKALEILHAIATDIFSPTADDPESLKHIVFPNAPNGPPHASRWIKAFLVRPAIPSTTRPLRRIILAFLVRIPNTYQQMLLESLQKETLTFVEGLVIEIFAHWLMLVILLEDESWCIGDMGVRGIQELQTLQEDCLPRRIVYMRAHLESRQDLGLSQHGQLQNESPMSSSDYSIGTTTTGTTVD